jgi:predicted DNA binding CopG/RHH family protein
MPKAIKTPKFKTAAEEALWWEKNQSLLLNEFEQAAKDGTMGRGTLTRRKGQTPTITIRLDPTDVELARAQAEERGLRYQTYLKMVLHQALAQEAGKSVSIAEAKR